MMFGMRGNSYCENRFLSERKPLAERILTGAKVKLEEIVKGEKEDTYESPFKYCDIEETYERKITGVRQSGGGERATSLFERIHEEQSRLLRVVTSPTAPAKSSSCDRPYVPDFPKLKDSGKKCRWEKNLEKRLVYLRRKEFESGR